MDKFFDVADGREKNRCPAEGRHLDEKLELDSSRKLEPPRNEDGNIESGKRTKKQAVFFHERKHTEKNQQRYFLSCTSTETRTCCAEARSEKSGYEPF